MLLTAALSAGISSPNHMIEGQVTGRVSDEIQAQI
jgi:hypothetical protein